MNITMTPGSFKPMKLKAAEAERQRLLKLRRELDRFAAALPALDNSTPLIRADRGR